MFFGIVLPQNLSLYNGLMSHKSSSCRTLSATTQLSAPVKRLLRGGRPLYSWIVWRRRRNCRQMPSASWSDSAWFWCEFYNVLHRNICSNSSDIMIELCILPRVFCLLIWCMVLATCLGLQNLAYTSHVEGTANQNPVLKHFLGVHCIFFCEFCNIHLWFCYPTIPNPSHRRLQYCHQQLWERVGHLELNTLGWCLRDWNSWTGWIRGIFIIFVRQASFPPSAPASLYKCSVFVSCFSDIDYWFQHLKTWRIFLAWRASTIEQVTRSGNRHWSYWSRWRGMKFNLTSFPLMPRSARAGKLVSGNRPWFCSTWVPRRRNQTSLPVRLWSVHVAMLGNGQGLCISLMRLWGIETVPNTER